MFNRYFKQEMDALKDLAAEYSKAHPAVAPMLKGSSSDPDVERLLEGTAFLTGLLREKLDDEFPEIVHALTQLIWPHYLRPIPAASIVAFRPKPALKTSVTIKKGIHLSSVSVEGTPCLFSTCFAIDLHPLHLLDAVLTQPAGKAPAIKLKFELRGPKLADWTTKSLRFFLAGDYVDASNLYLLLRNHLQQILISPLEGGSPVSLRPEFLHPAGFSDREGLIPYPSNSYPGYRILQEYFILPDKFLFLDLSGWEHWRNRGDGNRFEIAFELKNLPAQVPRINRESFSLFTTPVINLFPHEADPIRLDHRKTEYPVRPAGTDSSHYQVYTVDKVVGFIQGSARERKYLPFDQFTGEAQSVPVFHETIRKSPVKDAFDVFLSVAYPPELGPPEEETLSVRIRATNGPLPQSLQVGDISVPTSSSPEFCEFSNIRPLTASVLPPMGRNLLWRFLSHLSLNYLSLEQAKNLKALLELYLFVDGQDQSVVSANRKRIGGIRHIEAVSADRLVSGIIMRGRNIKINMNKDHFAGSGDLFLFGEILDHFLGSYASLNTFTRLTVEETREGGSYRWPARIGDRFLV